jgi:hypothetical protein
MHAFHETKLNLPLMACAEGCTNQRASEEAIELPKDTGEAHQRGAECWPGRGGNGSMLRSALARFRSVPVGIWDVPLDREIVLLLAPVDT